MKEFDVIIVGAGPAGLICAETLGDSGLSVLLLEKNAIFGEKVCAGGLTRKDLSILDVPDEILEHKVTRTAVISRKRISQTNAPEPFIFTVNRVAFGTWQKSRLEYSNIEIKNNSKVTQVEPKKITVNDSEEYAYKYLVGADGYFSIVRKYLKLPQEKRLIGLQYTVPDPVKNPRLEIHLNATKFFSWYAWSFPHENSIAVGCVADPRKVSTKQLRINFRKWLQEKEINVSNAKYEAFPISYDYRGIKFDNCFLAGEAAGMASGFTGEGIYQSLVSGITVGKTILNGNYKSQEMLAVLKYNLIQERIMNVLIKAGPFRGWIHELIVILLNNKRIKAKINSSFS